jgi:hypothetical protein
MRLVIGTIRPMLPRLCRLGFLAALVALPLVSCGSECDTCSSDADCEEGLVCARFSDGSQRCGSGVGASTCRVR